MSKRKIQVIYDSKLNKKELFESAKEEIIEIFNKLKSNKSKSDKNEQLLNELLKLDNEKDNYFRMLFILSLYCSYFHKNKLLKNNKSDLSFPIDECYKKHNFVILDIDDNHHEILNDLAIYFNTDATNLEPITGKILYDLHNLKVKYSKM
jgi:hypothetical protein